MPFTDVLLVIAASAASIGYVETQGDGPAPYASPGLGVVSRARYYAAHRRQREIFRGLLLALALCLVSAVLRAGLVAGAAWAAPGAAFIWAFAAFATAYESRRGIDPYTGLPRQAPWSERAVLRGVAVVLYLVACCFIRFGG